MVTPYMHVLPWGRDLYSGEPAILSLLPSEEAGHVLAQAHTAVNGMLVSTLPIHFKTWPLLSQAPYWLAIQFSKRRWGNWGENSISDEGQGLHMGWWGSI